MKAFTYFVLTLIILAVVGGFVFAKSKDYSPNSNVVANNGGEAQKVVIGMKNYNYYPNTIKVKAGQPVSITLDESVYGCFRSFTIKDFGVNKYLRTPQDTAEFTPTKKGKYRFACSMGMGTGTLIVE